MATIEPVSWVIRLGKETKKSGDDFTGVCYAVKAGIGTLRLTGMLSTEDKLKFVSELLRLRRELIAMGFNKIIYERITEDGFVTEELILRNLAAA